jgi:hypothetical protein
MATVGYFQGTDPRVLTKLAVEGIGTLPLSNGFDNYGKHVNHLTPKDGISVVVGYLHKVLPTPGMSITPLDLLFACKTHEIPVLLVVGTPQHEQAGELLVGVGEFVQLVDPEDLYPTITRVISATN